MAKYCPHSQIMTDGSQGLDALCFIDPISSTSNSRFLLALYETNARMEKGCASTSSFSGSTVDFRGANPEAPSGFPELLSTLAGPICSIPDDGSEMFDSYAKPWRKVEAEEMGAEAAVEESPSGKVGDSEWTVSHSGHSGRGIQLALRVAEEILHTGYPLQVFIVPDGRDNSSLEVYQ
ncbi:uncharacterized protein TRAVEDRAFT_21915 [Trametes versicolor FP-101664 SS1]|uniref:uncharacterized protein n=1 Tax=Trametes versicolor (strain FP-101664) TaxID=717944 RepID=UPI000462218B|nr:uncharacterized protein TRAVEDRAFT_21915 [Trametes versicolor FP-101664 SS1]EIW57001.1 hypothetical protein TRAVEDRAFT_21915 [Trametes versicolor FP-101664 SS1]